MESDVGYVCGRCDSYAPLGTGQCPECSAELGFGRKTAGASASVAPSAKPSTPAVSEPPPAAKAPEPPPPPPPEIGPISIPIGFKVTEALMEQARSFVCKKCFTPVPPGHKFCGRCGEPVPREVLTSQTLLFSKMLEPGRAKLVVVKGEGISAEEGEEMVFLLSGRQHTTGRTQCQIPFSTDLWVSPRHANFYYRDDGKLILKDEGSINGVFVKVRQPVELAPGGSFLSGEQLFRVDPPPAVQDKAEPDGTYFFSSQKRPAVFRLTQLLRGGYTGMVICARENFVTIGRDNCDMNFPNDPYMSGRHCKIELGANGKFLLHDLQSKNGTYARIQGEREMNNGDFVFIGRQLLRVDITT